MREGWQQARLGDVCKVVAGQSPKGSAYNNDGDGLPFHQGKKYFRETLLGDSKTWTTQITKEAFPGDILMSVRAPVGPINFTDQHMCIGRGLAAIRATEKVDRMFLFYWLSFIQSEIQGNEGAVFASINKQQIENIGLPLPPLAEQQRIVAILDEAFSGIATAVANTEKNLANARELFESYLSAIFCNTAELEAKGWEFVKLVEICEKITDGVHKKPTYVADGIPFIKINNLTAGPGISFDNVSYISEKDHKELTKRTNPERGDILITKDGTIGIVRVIDTDVQFSIFVSVALIKPKDKEISPYLKYVLESPLIQGEIKPRGTALKHLYLRDLREFDIPLPPEKERERIVADLDSLTYEIRCLESLYQQKLNALADLKQSLLQKAFFGELTTAPQAEIETALA